MRLVRFVVNFPLFFVYVYMHFPFFICRFLLTDRSYHNFFTTNYVYSLCLPQLYLATPVGRRASARFDDLTMEKKIMRSARRLNNGDYFFWILFV